MAKRFNLETGKRGEELAKEHLQEKGYKIIEQNYRTRYGEIDLVCQHKKELVLVEVRTKKGEDFGAPEDSLNQKKLRKIWLNALAYVGRKNWQGDYRVDAVCVVLGAGGELERLEHYQNII